MAESRALVSIVIISRDEPGLMGTLQQLEPQRAQLAEEVQVVVVDASEGRLSTIARRFADRVEWIDFIPPRGVKISIPHQRNAGIDRASGDPIVFIDAGCAPRAGWLGNLVAAVREHEDKIATGLTVAPAGTPGYYDIELERLRKLTHVDGAATINLAVCREVFDRAGTFDETFEYGSDLDFTWRAVQSGFAIRVAHGAVVEHDWGSRRRQLKRAFRYGRARVLLYAKHPERRRGLWRSDPIVLAYPAFLLGLPLTLVWWPYPLLLLVPLWRSRRNAPAMVLADHLVYGAGVLAALWTRVTAATHTTS